MRNTTADQCKLQAMALWEDFYINRKPGNLYVKCFHIHHDQTPWKIVCSAANVCDISQRY